MGIFNRKKPEKLEVLESFSQPGITYMPIIGQLNSKSASYKSELETYKMMEKDAIISGALQLYATDSTQIDSERGHSVWVESSSSALKEELEDFLYNTLNVEQKLFGWAYRIARDGQLFIRTFDSDNNREWEFDTVKSDVPVYPLVKHGKVINYYSELDDEGFIFGPDEFISFITSINDETEKIKLSDKRNGRELEFETTRGESFLKGSVIAWKVLSTLEDVLFITRVGKSSVFNLVKIEVGSASKKEADALIEKAKKIFKTREAINLVDGMYKSQNSPIASNENIYVPMRNGVGNMTIESVGGNYELKEALDLDYFRNKLFASLHIPKSYLGFDGEQASVLGDNSLTRADERYARGCKRLQNVLRTGLFNLCRYYLKKTGRDVNLLSTFKICMTGISSVEEKTRREEFGARLDNAQKVVDLALANFPNEVDTTKFFSYVFGNILGLNTEDFSNGRTNALPVRNLNLRGTGYGSYDGNSDRKFIRLSAPEVDSVQLNDDISVSLDVDGKLYTLNEFLDSPACGRLDEATYKKLKQRVQTSDPDRVRKAKKLTTTYLGLNRNGDLMFKTSSGTTQGKFWYQTIRLLDLPQVIEAFADDEEITDKDIVDIALNGDIALYCNDPSFKYYGWQWMATADGYGIKPETRPPIDRNPNLIGAVCKHLYVVLYVLPFWTNKIVSDLRKQFFKTRPAGVKANKKVIDKDGKDQEWSLNKGDHDMLRSIPGGKSGEDDK